MIVGESARTSEGGRVNDSDWSLLLGRIENAKCTPFLGSGACWPTLPTGRQIAKEWAKEHGYPLEDREDLARVAQYIGVYHDLVHPKEHIVLRFKGRGVPDFAKADEPHAALAKLPIPIYITTNYDDFMMRALTAAGKQPRQEICRWNDHPAVANAPGALHDDPDYEPTAQAPLVFHLHGHLDVAESLVLTEEDYLDFLVAISERKDILPSVVKEAFAGTSLLFVGYSLADWDFRVLHRGLVMTSKSAALRRISVTVQLPRTERRKKLAREYLEKYFARMDARVYWGDANAFSTELADRWSARTNGD
jgi:SIR2-like domain